MSLGPFSIADVAALGASIGCAFALVVAVVDRRVLVARLNRIRRTQAELRIELAAATAALDELREERAYITIVDGRLPAPPEALRQAG
ncbi:MAG: hypothetical protein JO147_10125 [Actinobacteria bacterium]|nr:hypothetical protein [Actinomycetota bacterium]